MMHFILCSLLIFYVAFTLQFAGPGDMTLKRMEKCGEDYLGVTLDIKMKKINRSHLGVDAYLVLPFDLDDTVSCNLTAAKWGDGGWKPNQLDIYDKSACEMMKKYASQQMSTIFAMIEQPNSCPLKQGIYNISNFIFDTNMDLPLIYGKFMIDLMFTKNEIMAVCMRGYFDVEPKKTVG